MSDVAREGRTVMFVSHNMSAILRLTEETIVIDEGHLLLRAPTPKAVDFYLSLGLMQEGQRYWQKEEIYKSAASFQPIGIRVINKKGEVTETVRSTEPVFIEIEYAIKKSIKGLRVGVYLTSTRGEFIFTSFDTDNSNMYEEFSVRPAGHYISKCKIPANFFNGGRFVVGMNASSYKIKRYFQDERALIFTVDASGSPGMQWPEKRLGPIRPSLNL